MFDALARHMYSGMTSFRGSGVEDTTGGVRELGQAVLIHAVVHEGAAPLGDDEADVTQDLQVMRDRRLARAGSDR